MISSIQNSWRHSLAAVTVAALFGWGDASAPAAHRSDEPAQLQKEVADEKDRDVAAAQMKQRLEKIAREIDELRAAGKDDAAERMAAEAREIKAQLEKIRAGKDEKGQDKKHKITADQADPKHAERAKIEAHLKALHDESAKLREELKATRIAKEQAQKERFESQQKFIELQGKTELLAKKIAAEDNPKKSDAPIDELRERLKLLEAENAKLRDALKWGKDKAASQVDAAKEQYEKAFQAHAAQRAAMVHAKQGDTISAEVREKLEHLAKLAEELQDQGKKAEFEKVQKEMHRLAEVIEAAREKGSKHWISKEGEKWPEKTAMPPGHELGPMLRELREEVSRLRDEVAELRRMVKDRGEDPKGSKR